MKKWEQLSSERMLQTPWMSLLRNSYATPGGQTIGEYYIVERRSFVLVVASEAGHLLLLRQYRPATDRFYLCLPGGYIDEGEEPLEAARRELAEETGRVATGARLVSQLDPFPGYLRSRAYIVACDDVRHDPALALDPLETAEVLAVTWQQAVELVLSGEIDEMQAAGAILLCAALRDRAA